MKMNLRRDIERFLEEDGCNGPQNWPPHPVECRLIVKSPLIIAGMEWFCTTFELLGASNAPREVLLPCEGKNCRPGDEIPFTLPFSCAVRGERVALNLLARACSIATLTSSFVQLAKKKGIAILDTRKTTPGLRVLEKYAVTVGGGQNHRQNQRDVKLIKDNHKNFLGGVKKAVDFFKKAPSFYAPLVIEIDSLEELKELLKLKEPLVRHIMLDNFSPQEVEHALALKKDHLTYEISGGVTMGNINSYLLPGVDAISIGQITSFPPAVDLSLKYH